MSEKIKIEVKEHIILTTYWDFDQLERKSRTMQIKKITVSCGNCGSDFEMNATEKEVDILHETELWIGTCTTCFARNMIGFRITKERYRIPSDAMIVKLKAKAEGKELKAEGWIDE